MYTIRFETLGCRLNQIESESMARLFLEENFSVNMENVTSLSQEDSSTILCIINTCTVTQKAEQKARRLIRLLLKKYTNALVIVTGCYAQLSTEQIEKIDSRIISVKGQIKSRISDIPKLLSSFLAENDRFSYETFKDIIKKKILAKNIEKPHFPEDSFRLSTSTFLAHSRASLKIQDGCNNNCSYCAIHVARGHSVSIDVQTAIDRVKEIEQAGQSEVVLTTINIAQYHGKYGDTYCNFTQLLELLLHNTKKINFRISSLYPEIVDDDFCRVISDKRVRPHFHISVQSGSDKILKLMNRLYDSKAVEEACIKLRKYKENPFIACDIITGFPAENDDDFNQTMNLCKKCNFAWVHAFPFSERPGTEACKIKPKVPQSVSGERAKMITEWAIEQKINYINSFVGKELEVILENNRNSKIKTVDMYNSKTNSKDKKIYMYHGMTENFIHCEIESLVELPSDSCIKVVIEKPLCDRIVKGGEIEALAKIV